ncbi:MAG: hypothetical protein ACRDQA_01115 [Nocardioidaceae bacterium]
MIDNKGARPLSDRAFSRRDYDRLVMRSTPLEPLAETLSDGVVAIRFRIRSRRLSDTSAIGAASHDPETQRSIRVAEKCGFQRAGSQTEPAADSGQRTKFVVAHSGP